MGADLVCSEVGKLVRWAACLCGMLNLMTSMPHKQYHMHNTSTTPKELYTEARSCANHGQLCTHTERAGGAAELADVDTINQVMLDRIMDRKGSTREKAPVAGLRMSIGSSNVIAEGTVCTAPYTGPRAGASGTDFAGVQGNAQQLVAQHTYGLHADHVVDSMARHPTHAVLRRRELERMGYAESYVQPRHSPIVTSGSHSFLATCTRSSPLMRRPGKPLLALPCAFNARPALKARRRVESNYA